MNPAGAAIGNIFGFTQTARRIMWRKTVGQLDLIKAQLQIFMRFSLKMRDNLDVGGIFPIAHHHIEKRNGSNA